MRGQLFTLDFVIGLLITLGALIVAIVLLPTYEPPFSAEKTQVGVLMTEGVPENWTAADVITPGFISNGRFNQTKIDAFAAMDIQEQQRLLGIRSNFWIVFEQNGTALDLCSTCGTPPVDYDAYLVLYRHSLLGSNITTLEVHLYQ